MSNMKVFRDEVRKSEVSKLSLVITVVCILVTVAYVLHDDRIITSGKYYHLLP
jgi:FtsH-binding integral membrane protein